MRRRGSLQFVLFTMAAAAFAGSGLARVRAAAPTRGDLDAIVAKVGDRVAAYYQRAQQLICLERSTVVPITRDWTLDGFARTVESELRVEMDAIDGDRLPDAEVTRHILRVNGRQPAERDKKGRSGCTDPTPISPEPLAFLLPGHREAFLFTGVRDANEQGRAALAIDFSSAVRSSRPELIEDAGGHDDCFDWTGPVAIAGRVWVDAVSYDVLRLERHVLGPTEVRVPDRLQRKYQFSQWLTLDRDDLSLRYKEVRFTDPEEKVLLPETSQSITVFRSSLQSMRRTDTFSDYQRFLTESRFRIIGKPIGK